MEKECKARDRTMTRPEIHERLAAKSLKEGLQDSNHYQEEISLQVPNATEIKSRISSTSSASTDLNSLDTSDEGPETPVVQSDEEELQQDNPKEEETGS
uniref:Uncharacterized protein n=1 Tax=Sphaerodactylus townsendi TaxID=933632 RepID=A0ACB8F651_9SAUR